MGALGQGKGEGEGPAGGPLARTAQPRGAGGFPPVGRGVAPNQLYLSHIATIIARVRPPTEKGKARKMDMSKLTHGAKVVLGAAIAYFVVLIPHWQDYHGAGFSGWHGVGVICGLLVIALIAWQAIRLANINLEVGLTPAMVTAALAVLLVFFTVIKFLVANEFRTFWSWLGLILSIVIAVGAWMNMQAMGESISEMGTSMKSAASSAAAAAKAATDKADDAPAAPPAAAAPAPAAAAPEAPAPPPPAAPAAETPAPAAPPAEPVTETAAADDETPPATPA
jgi:hypothetical protein